MLILIKATNSKSPSCATYLSDKVPAVVSRSLSHQAYWDSAAIAIIVNHVLAMLVHIVVLRFFSSFLSSSRSVIPDVVHVLRHRRVNHGK